MAFRSTNSYRCLLNQLRGRATYTTSTSPKRQAYTPTSSFHGYGYEKKSNLAAEVAEFTPVYVALGLILLSSMLGLHTAKQHLLYSPAVRVKKKLRETIPEVVCPDKVFEESDHFIEKSFFRKVARVQEFESNAQPAMRNDVFAHSHRAETLKSVGIDPKLF